MSLQKTSDDKLLVRTSMFSLGWNLYIAGAGDDRTLGRGNGSLFTLTKSAIGSAEMEFYFNDLVELGGGHILFQNAALGDYVTFSIHAPASTVTPNTENEGNCNVVEGRIIPADGDGAYDIDLTPESEAPVPLPAQGAGYWNWSRPETGLGICTPAPLGDGFNHLIAAPLDLPRFVNKIAILGTHRLPFVYDGIDPADIHPQWKMKGLIYNATGDHDLNVAWHLITARAVTS